mmetsp:Transcript_1020/g.2817  ORF Transcript_1020/g.2817 Transcript_1020/m.2817 type:complete len:236 (+) Transcript_1020:1340-2047(+)
MGQSCRSLRSSPPRWRGGATTPASSSTCGATTCDADLLRAPGRTKRVVPMSAEMTTNAPTDAAPNAISQGAMPTACGDAAGARRGVRRRPRSAPWGSSFSGAPAVCPRESWRSSWSRLLKEKEASASAVSSGPGVRTVVRVPSPLSPRRRPPLRAVEMRSAWSRRALSEVMGRRLWLCLRASPDWAIAPDSPDSCISSVWPRLRRPPPAIMDATRCTCSSLRCAPQCPLGRRWWL